MICFCTTILKTHVFSGSVSVPNKSCADVRDYSTTWYDTFISFMCVKQEVNKAHNHTLHLIFEKTFCDNYHLSLKSPHFILVGFKLPFSLVVLLTTHFLGIVSKVHSNDITH